MIRLNKYLSEAGVCSRREADRLIEQGRVKVDGTPATVGMQVDEHAQITVDGKAVGEKKQKTILIAVNKPRGIVCSEAHQGNDTNIIEFLQYPKRITYMGRLDKDSEGLLLMTNDGELAYKLTHPKFTVDKTYHAVCDGVLTNAEIARLEQGVDIGDGMTGPAKITQVHALHNGNTSFDITIHEGRNRQIRRMLEAVGHQTLVLKRTKEGAVSIGFMQSGEYRALSAEELNALRQTELS